MSDAVISLLDTLKTVDRVVYVLVGTLGWLALFIDWFAERVSFEKYRDLIIRHRPPTQWAWLFMLFILYCIFEVLFLIPVYPQDSNWHLQLLAYVHPDIFQKSWHFNIFEEIFRFGTFFLLIRFTPRVVAASITTLLFVLIHDYYYLPLYEALAYYFLVFILGSLFLFVGLRFGILVAYLLHLAINTFQVGVYVTAPPEWLWLNWLLAFFVGLAIVYPFKSLDRRR